MRRSAGAPTSASTRSKSNESEFGEVVAGSPSPGDFLREKVMSGELTQEELADALGVSRVSVNQLVNNRRSVTAEMALRLGRAFDTSPEFWLRLQQAVDLEQARRRLADDLIKVRRVLSRV